MDKVIVKNDDQVVVSDKKLKMIEMFSNGYRTPEISKTLFLSVRTVEVQMYELRKALDCKTTTQLACEFIRKGLIK